MTADPAATGDKQGFASAGKMLSQAECRPLNQEPAAAQLLEQSSSLVLRADDKYDGLRSLNSLNAPDFFMEGTTKVSANWVARHSQGAHHAEAE